MNITIHQAICGQLADGGFGCIKSTLSDDASNKSIGFKSDLQDPDGGIPWSYAIRGFLLNNHFLLIKTFPDKSPEARPGRNFSHVLIIEKKDLSAITNIEELYPHFLKEVDKTIQLEQIQLNQKAKTTIHLEDGIKKRFNKVVHGIHKIKDYSNTIIWVGQENYETAVSKLWQILSLEQKQALHLGINFNVDAIKKDKLNFITIPGVVESKFLRSEYCVIKKADTYELKEFAEQYLAEEDGVSEKIKKFSDAIQTKKLTLEDIEVVSKIMATFENLSETKDVRKLLTLSNVVATYSPDNSKGLAFKQKIVATILAAYYSATAEDIYLLRKYKVDAFIDSEKSIKENVSDWLKKKFEKPKEATNQQIVSLITLVLEEQKENWLSKSIISVINKFAGQLNSEKVSILFSWFYTCENLFSKIKIKSESQNDILFSEEISKKCSKKQLDILTELSIKNEWYNSLASIYRLVFDQETAIKEFLSKNSKSNNLEGIDIIIQGITDKEIIQITLEVKDPRLVAICVEKCLKDSSLLNKLDANNPVWIDIWAKAVLHGNKLEEGILKPQIKVFQVFDQLIKGTPIEENLLANISKSHFSSILKYPQRTALWGKLKSDHRNVILLNTFSEVASSNSERIWNTTYKDVKLEILKFDALNYILKNANTLHVLWLFKNCSELSESKLIDFLNLRGISLSSADCKELGILINVKRLSSVFNLINNNLVKSNSNFNQTIDISANTFRKNNVTFDPFGLFGTSAPKKNFNSKKKIKILFTSANPNSRDRIRIDAEQREIDNALQSSKFRENVDLISKGALQFETFAKAILENEPAIVHFSGHADKYGIALEKQDGEVEPVSNEALNKLFALFKGKVKCVVLNACYSENQAKIISKHDIYVVGMNDEIDDSLAINFSKAFYTSICTGKGAQYCYDYAIAQVIVKNEVSSEIPALWYNGQKISTHKTQTKIKAVTEKEKSAKPNSKKKSSKNE